LVLTASTAAAGSPDPKDLAVPDADMSRARGLVHQLGSEVFDERETAHEDLAKMGRLAFPALVDALKNNSSPEVRFRCQSLITKAAQADLQARLNTFLEDKDGKYQHDMPGWNEFKTLTGESPTSRTAFVELLKTPANRSLVLAVGSSPIELGNLVAARKQELYHMRVPRTPNTVRKDPSVQDIVSLMFAEGHVETKYVPRVTNATSSIVYNAVSLNRAINDGSEQSKVYKSVVANWIVTRDDPQTMYTAMNQATQLGLTKEAADIAGRLLHAKGGIPTYRIYAAFAIAKNGAKGKLVDLESAFSDEAGLNIGGVVINGKVEARMVQVRDMALAAALLLTGQNTDEYGFTQQYKGQTGMQYTYSNWRLAEDKRKEAFEKWKAWRAKNPDFGKEKK
jgi:hypothetical protein